MVNLSSLINFKSVLEPKNFNQEDKIFSVDNRQLCKDSIFIAIVGERFNPLEHLAKVVQSECQYVVYERNKENDKLINEYSGKLNFIAVTNITDFITEAGVCVASEFKSRGGKIIAISGSNGKTTTKEMLYHTLKEVEGSKSVICTQKNYNNHLGVPFTLFQIRKGTRFAIVELGSNHPGEIEHLCKILHPQYGITTNIGDTHLEFFETRENVFKEEGILHKYCSELFFKNEDDLLLSSLSSEFVSYGENGKNYKFEIAPDKIIVNEMLISNKEVTGRHNFINLGVAFIIAASILECDASNIIKALSNFKPTPNRSQWIDYKSQKIFLDAYNANPSSMRVAIEGFIDSLQSEGHDLSSAAFVVGDMNELGANEKKYHLELGEFMQQKTLKNVYFVGRFAEDFQKGFDNKSHTYSDAKKLKQMYDAQLAGFKYLFIKGSRSLQLESILDIK